MLFPDVFRAYANDLKGARARIDVALRDEDVRVLLFVGWTGKSDLYQRYTHVAAITNLQEAMYLLLDCRR